MPSQLVQIATFHSAVSAGLARAQLEADGIRSFLTNEFGSASGGGAVGLQVAELDAERARALLGSSDAPRAAGEAGVHCVICRSAELERVDWSWPLRVLRSLLLMAVPLPAEWFGGRRVRCRVCGYESRESDESRRGAEL